MDTDNKDLKWIKKHYSEKLMHICRELFPQLLEHEGVLPRVLEANFAHSSSLGEDIEAQGKRNNFKDFIYSQVDVENNHQIVTNKSPEELMSEAGYILYPECKSEADIQSFRHYYYRKGKTPTYNGGTPAFHQGEELCTFNGGRLGSCRVWFAVKKEVAENPQAIKRAEHPTRQDNYGTSVISIQFSRGKNSTLSIKNRYNHSVNNPDNTFNSNLDNIIPGLMQAFSETYGIDISKQQKTGFELDNYVKANDGKFYRYNMEIDNIYYCENNTIIDNFEVKTLDPRYVLMDYFIADLSTNSVEIYDKRIKDAFLSSLGDIEKILLEKDEEKNKVLRIVPKVGEDILITLNKHGEIYKLTNNNVETCGSDFLGYNTSLTNLNSPNLETCGSDFLGHNTSLTNLNTQKLKSSGSYLLFCNNSLTTLDLPNFESCGNCCLNFNESLTSINVPMLKKYGYGFLGNNRNIDIDKIINAEYDEHTV